MISFTLSLLALIVGFMLYGRFVEHVFGPDNRLTPAVANVGDITETEKLLYSEEQVIFHQ